MSLSNPVSDRLNPAHKLIEISRMWLELVRPVTAHPSDEWPFSPPDAIARIGYADMEMISNRARQLVHKKTYTNIHAHCHCHMLNCKECTFNVDKNISHMWVYAHTLYTTVYIYIYTVAACRGKVVTTLSRSMENSASTGITFYEGQEDIHYVLWMIDFEFTYCAIILKLYTMRCIQNLSIKRI